MAKICEVAVRLVNGVKAVSTTAPVGAADTDRFSGKGPGGAWLSDTVDEMDSPTYKNAGTDQLMVPRTRTVTVTGEKSCDAYSVLAEVTEM
jgi:hypothetical protein